MWENEQMIRFKSYIYNLNKRKECLWINMIKSSGLIDSSYDLNHVIQIKWLHDSSHTTKGDHDLTLVWLWFKSRSFWFELGTSLIWVTNTDQKKFTHCIIDSRQPYPWFESNTKTNCFKISNLWSRHTYSWFWPFSWT